MAHLVVGIDSSTQSTKVEVRELDSGRIVASASSGHPATTPPRSEQDPRSWWEALQKAFADTGVAAGDVAAISVGGQQHGLVLLDADGEPVRPAKLWNDTESSAQADSLVSRLGAKAWAEAVGSVPGAAFTISKLAWVAEHEPGRLAQAAKIMLPHDYFNFRLTGNHVTDRGDASGSGWWSAQDGVRTDLLALVGQASELASKVPTVLGPTEAAGVVTNGACGFADDTPVAIGTGDNMAAALGLGLRRGDVAISLGTSGTVYAITAESTHDATGAVAGFADATGAFLPLVCTLNATKATDSVRRLLGVGLDEFNELALAAEPGSDGMVLVPYFDGERTPNRPFASATLTGVRSDVSREALARASVEGVACGLLEGLDALIDLGVEPTGRYFLIGGGSRSTAFQRVVADLIGHDIQVPDSDQAVATGACVQAAALISGDGFGEIADRWQLGAGLSVTPNDVDRLAIRARYKAMAEQSQSFEELELKRAQQPSAR